MIDINNNKSGQLTKPLQCGQRGISLIDALIALVIFSVGMLGIAALQTVSKQSNFEAIQRSHAASLAYDLFERMRMNSGPHTNYVSSTTITITDQTYAACSAGCDQAAIAANDLYEWKQMLSGFSETESNNPVGGIVNPTACLDGPPAPVGTTEPHGKYTLTIVWRGQTKIANQSASTCGAGTGLYDDSTTDDYAYRRILELSTFM